MGSNINGLLEQFVDGQWEFVCPIPRMRDQFAYAALASKGNCFDIEPISEPRGLPADRRQEDWFDMFEVSQSWLDMAEVIGWPHWCRHPYADRSAWVHWIKAVEFDRPSKIRPGQLRIVFGFDQ